MAEQQPNLWSSGDAYERYMGRWSRQVAPRFLSFMSIRPSASWIDVGCGTGVLTQAILEHADPGEVTGIDNSETMLQLARARLGDAVARFESGDAAAIKLPADSADAVVSGLVLNFVPDKQAATSEMVRVLRPGGTLGLYVWDYAGHMQIMRHLFDAALAFDPKAADYDDGTKAPICRPGPLADLLKAAGLESVSVSPIDIPAAFESFDDYWAPFLGGTGSAPKYVTSLSGEDRTRLRDAVRERLPTGPDGEILLAVRAWAAKGTKPA